MVRAGTRLLLLRATPALLLVSVVSVAAATPARAQLADRVVESRRLEQAAREAAKAGSNAEYLRLIGEAAAARPHHPYLLYQLADAHALVGDTAAALDALARVADMGIAVSPGDEPDFAGFAARRDFRSLLDRFARNAGPVGAAEEAFGVDEEAFLPEGLARDPRDGAFFLASVHRKLVARVEGGAPVRLFPVDPVLSPMGMVVDTARGLLWVAASAVAEGEGTDSTHQGTASLLALDPATGRRVGSWPAPDDGKRHLFGDLALGPDGAVVVSDSWAPGLYRLGRAERALEAVPLAEPLLSPQGVAFADDGVSVYLADYALGILRIDLGDGAVRSLDYPADRTLLGVDGLYRAGPSTLVGVQNGVTPTRVVRLDIAAGGGAIETVTVLEAGHPLHDDPTLGVVVGDALYYVANGQWGKFAADADDGGEVTAPVILRVPLAPRPAGDRLYGTGGVR